MASSLSAVAKLMTFAFTNRHPERSEGSSVELEEILRCAQDDKAKTQNLLFRTRYTA
jgi:hypothetical protein